MKKTKHVTIILLMCGILLTSCSRDAAWQRVSAIDWFYFRYQESTQSLWTVDFGSSQVVRISPISSSERITETIQIPSDSTVMDLCASKNVWLVTLKFVYEINPATNEITERYRIEGDAYFSSCFVLGDGSVNIISSTDDLDTLYQDVEGNPSVVELPFMLVSEVTGIDGSTWALSTEGVYHYVSGVGWEKWSEISGDQMNYVAPDTLWVRSGMRYSIISTTESGNVPEGFLKLNDSLAEDYSLIDQTPDGVIWIANQSHIDRYDGAMTREIWFPENCSSAQRLQVEQIDDQYYVFILSSGTAGMDGGIYWLKLPK